MAKLKEYRDLSDVICQEYGLMSKTFSDFQSRSNLPCPKSCGQCCSNPQIEATPLEMLPMVMKLLDEGKLNIEYLDSVKERSICFFFKQQILDPSKGWCQEYQYRPSICRMFGVSGYNNKDKTKSLSICKVLKEKYPNEYPKTYENISSAPLMSKWSTRVNLLDTELGLKYFPINQAFIIMAKKIILIADYDES